MKPEDFIKAVGEFDEDTIADSEVRSGGARPPFIRWIIVAAAVVLLAAGAVIVGLNVSRPGKVPPVHVDSLEEQSDVPSRESEVLHTIDSTDKDKTTDSDSEPDTVNIGEPTDSSEETDGEPILATDRADDPSLTDQAGKTDPRPVEPDVTDDVPVTQPDPETDNRPGGNEERSTETESDSETIESNTEESSSEADTDADPPETTPFDPEINLSTADARELLYVAAGSPKYYYTSSGSGGGSGYSGGSMGSLFSETKEYPRDKEIALWWSGELFDDYYYTYKDFRIEKEGITRLDAAGLLYLLANCMKADLPEIREYNGFEDAPLYGINAKVVGYVYRTGLMDPISEDEFGVSEYATRAELIEAANVIASAAGE